MQYIRLRTNDSDDDTPTEIEAVRRQVPSKDASIYAQRMEVDATADLVGISTPAGESLPVEFNFAPTPDQQS